MKLILRNIGKIKEAEIDLDKQLTVFFGPNNNGKTYVSYCLYGFLNGTVRNFLNSQVELKIDFEKLINEGSVTIDLFEILKPIRNHLKENFVDTFRSLLSNLFGHPSFSNQKSIIYPSFLNSDSEFSVYLKSFHFSLTEAKRYGAFNLNFSKQGYNLTVQADFNNFSENETEKIRRLLKQDVCDYIVQYTLLKDNNSTSFFLPAERIGIAIFSKELLLNRFENTSGVSKSDDFVTYSSIINDAIKSQFKTSSRRISSVKKIFLDLAAELENNILQGKLTLAETGDVFYNNDELKSLSILNTASTIKSLSSLVFYLRYSAEKGQTLFIDEPEINLHPDNQRKIARFLAKLSNAGVKIFLSTHSDYLLREFNTLLMLNKSSDETAKLMEKYGFKKEEVLSHGNVGAYLFKDGFAKEIEVTETGFSAETIDETISEQNKAFNDIRWTLFED